MVHLRFTCSESELSAAGITCGIGKLCDEDFFCRGKSLFVQKHLLIHLVCQQQLTKIFTRTRYLFLLFVFVFLPFLMTVVFVVFIIFVSLPVFVFLLLVFFLLPLPVQKHRSKCNCTFSPQKQTTLPIIQKLDKSKPRRDLPFFAAVRVFLGV